MDDFSVNFENKKYPIGQNCYSQQSYSIHRFNSTGNELDEHFIWVTNQQGLGCFYWDENGGKVWLTFLFKLINIIVIEKFSEIDS